MHPIIFKCQFPEFLQSFLGVEFLTLYSYAFYIFLGTVLATFIMQELGITEEFLTLILFFNKIIIKARKTLELFSFSFLAQFLFLSS